MKLWALFLFLLVPKFVYAEYSSETFSDQIKLEFRDLGLAYFKNLKDCHNRNPQLQALIDSVEDYNSSRSISLFQQQYTPLQILLAPDLYKRLTYQSLIELVRPLIQIQKTYTQVCGQEFHSFGSGFFDASLSALLEQASSRQKWNLVSIAYQSFYRMGGASFELLQSWLPTSLTKAMPMLKESWIGPFIHSLATYEPLNASLTRLLSTSAEKWRSSADAIYQWIQPFRINSYDLLNENLIFPGIQQLVHRRTSDHWQCMVDMAEAKFWPSFGIKNLIPELLQFSKLFCPQLSENERLTLFYSDDRMSHWLLPLTFKLALIENPEWLKNPEWLSKIEKFSAKLKQLHTGHGFNHIIVPYAVAAIEKKQPFAKELILLAGALYQILDAESKIRLYTFSAEEIQRQALDDLKIWHEVLN